MIVTWTDARTTAAIINALRTAGMTQLFVGGSEIVTDDFPGLLVPDPGSVIALRPGGESFHLPAEDRQEFAQRYRAQYPTARKRRGPDVGAYLSFEATHHLLAAINRAGLERDAVRRTLQAMNEGCLARLEDGRWTMVEADR